MPALDIRGCLEDSPTFRKRIQSHEESIHNFEHSLKSLIKLTRSQVEISTGKDTYFASRPCILTPFIACQLIANNKVTLLVNLCPLLKLKMILLLVMLVSCYEYIPLIVNNETLR